MNSSFESLIEQYPLPIAEQLRHWAARYASRIAVVDAKGSLTYSALDARVDELAAGLSSLGLRSGEHVIVQLPNDNAFVTLLFALLRLGVIPVLAMPPNGRWISTHWLSWRNPSLTLFTGKTTQSWPDRWRTNTPACVMFWSLERP
ncbi:enterobactin synthase subunit E [Salmonella enterica subsp. diarizonae]|uniref:Enterobactin synthase subunit E n=1 Tax=Salmonella diarizonae TaxID=59204 RepID=A0A379U0V3_SALDZ|nr:enterobactin synthase subunit E [Salmonella enterica subsp. diarizonae]